MSRIAICAPSTPISRDVAERVTALVAAEFVLIAVAMLAMMRPALRATRTDPVEVLRAA